MIPLCARCGYPQREHSYNGACYGLCGEFEEAQAMTQEHEDWCHAEIKKLSAKIERLQRINEELLSVLKSIGRIANQAAFMNRAEEPKP